MEEIMKRLTDRDSRKAYAYLKELVEQCAASDHFYPMFEEVAARFPKFSRVFHDEKPTVVRQALGCLPEVLLFQPEPAALL